MKKSRGQKIFNVINIMILLMISLVSVYPFINQLAISLSSTKGILNHTVTLFPVDVTLQTYKEIIKNSAFWVDYLNTIIYTTLGTLLGLILTTMSAYALSKKNLYGSTVIMKFFVFTIFVGGGLIPTFILVKNLGLVDTIWSLIIPQVILPYHILLMRTYFEGLPEELEDAGRLDGLGQFGYFWKIALPLSKPILATMTLFIAVLYWNDWFSALIYLTDDTMHPVTLYLRNVMMGATNAAQTGSVDAATRSIPQGIQAASLILVIVPVMLIYPKVQKHFVKGVMIGAVKG